MLDVRQSEQLVYTAATEVPDFERQITQQENAISMLLGNNPGDVPRGLKLTEQPHAPEVPSGLAFDAVGTQADIRQAEQSLVAANAQIGVARAAYFPQISLTGTAGYESPALTSLFTGPAGIWNLAGSFTQPIFEGGQTQVELHFAEAQREQSLLTYQQTIQGAFRDVSNGLVAYRKNREFRLQQERLLASAQDASHLERFASRPAPPTTSKCSPTRQILSTLNWGLRKRKPANCSRWFSSIRRWGADGKSKHPRRRSGRSCRSPAGVAHLLHEQALGATLVVMPQGYDADFPGTVLARDRNELAARLWLSRPWQVRPRRPFPPKPLRGWWRTGRSRRQRWA